MASTTGRRKRQRGEVATLPSGSLRVAAGTRVRRLDPVSKKRHYLTEVVSPGPTASAQAEKVRTRLLAEVDEQRQPRTSATVGQMLDRYMAVLHIEESTRAGYERLLRKHVRPLLATSPSGG